MGEGIQKMAISWSVVINLSIWLKMIGNDLINFHSFGCSVDSRKIANSRLVVFFDIFAALEMPIIKELRCKIFWEMRCLSGWVRALTRSCWATALPCRSRRAVAAAHLFKSQLKPQIMCQNRSHFHNYWPCLLCHNNPSIFTPFVSNLLVSYFENKWYLLVYGTCF